MSPRYWRFSTKLNWRGNGICKIEELTLSAGQLAWPTKHETYWNYVRDGNVKDKGERREVIEW